MSRSIPSASARARDHPGEQRVVVELGPDGHGPLAASVSLGSRTSDRRVRPVLRAQAFADRAPAERAVEREVVRRRAARSCGRSGRRRSAGCSGRPASAARPASSSTWATCSTPLPRSRAVSTASASRDRGRPADDHAVDDHLDHVLAAVVDLGRLVEADTTCRRRARARSPSARISSQSVSYFSPSAPLERGHEVELRPLGQVQDLVDDLVGRLRADRDVAVRAVAAARAGRRGCAGSRRSR